VGTPACRPDEEEEEQVAKNEHGMCNSGHPVNYAGKVPNQQQAMRAKKNTKKNPRTEAKKKKKSPYKEKDD